MREKIDYSKTLIIKADSQGLQYDINGILKSFYPDMNVRVLTMDGNWELAEAVHDSGIMKQPVCMDVKVKDRSVMVYFMPGDTTCSLPHEFHYEIDAELGAKNTFKRFMYDMVCEISGRTLPWGNLTGIRPTKIAMNLMNEGMNDAEVKKHLQNLHRVSDEKMDLAIDIAHREDALLSKIDPDNRYSLYIGIPFCPTTCLYCSFTSYAIAAWKDRVDEYLDALFKEIDYVAKEFEAAGCEVHGSGRRRYPDTVYIGGGTPTSLDEEHLEKLLEKITTTIDMSHTLEFTCEAGRPDSITPEKLRIMKKYGVTRISVNPQTMQQKTLDLIGRKTKVEQVIESFKSAREIGFDNINMDIILGLPGEGVEEVADTLKQIKELKPDSLTVHSLAIKRASALKQRLDEIGVNSLVNTDETMNMSSQAAIDMGMKPYYLYRQKNMSGNFENTGFAVPGKEGLYNILIMEEVQTIVACGAGTVTKRVIPLQMIPGDGVTVSFSNQEQDAPPRISRCENLKDVKLYISKIDEMIERKRQLFR